MQQLPNVPKWTFSSRAHYGFTVNADMEANIGLGLRYEGTSRSAFMDGGISDTLLNVPTDSYMAVDLNTGVSWDNISLNLYATNLFNEGAMTSTFSFNPIFLQPATGVPLKPRTIGASLSFDF